MIYNVYGTVDVGNVVLAEEMTSGCKLVRWGGSIIDLIYLGGGHY